MKKQLHIVCLDVPWPADYGGAIDMMNRIRAFNCMGIGVHLHYFSYNERGTPKELEPFCCSIHAYPRKRKSESIRLDQPYIVASRCNKDLIQNINQDNHPVLLEGLHCSGIIDAIQKDGRKICIRMHNDEEVYYKELARSSSNLFKKTYFYAESRLIRKYMQSLPNDLLLACVSMYDIDHFKKIGFTNSFYMPTFPSWQKVESQTGIGCHCLFQGKLSVPENEEAALWLLNNVFNQVRIPFIIAGMNPSNRLQKVAALCQHTHLIANPTEQEMDDLVQKAHINILPNLNKRITGIRLKLLHALYRGRHCVTTPTMVDGTGLADTCHIGTSAKSIASIIAQLYYQPFEEEEIRLREYLLSNTFNNINNLKLLVQRLW